MIDDELGTLGRCPRCGDDWPAEDEFFAPGDDVCRACRYEERETRRRQLREASRRYRERRRTA